VKKWKWVLAVVAAPFACVGLLWIDTYFRAVDAIRAEDERLAKDIAVLRSRRSAPQAAIYRLEEGHTGMQDPKANQVLKELFGCRFAPPASNILAQLTLLLNRLREGGYILQGYRGQKERVGVIELRLCLEKNPPPEPELQKLREAFEALEKSRPTAAECVTEEHLLDRAEVLRVLHRKEDPRGMIVRPPGWREFFSWRILIAKALHQLDDHHREIQAMVENRTVPAFDVYKTRREEPDVLSRTRLRFNVDHAVDLDRKVLLEWEQTRAVVRPK